MASLGAPPDSLRPIAPFVQRAKEMEKADEVIAYWCLYHAAQTAMTSRTTDPEPTQYLMKLLDALEALKSKLAGNDAVTDDTAATAYVENFALKVFDGADNEDRAGKASRSTAMRFLAASTFLEVLGSVSPSGADAETVSKIKYSKWKASDISKALRSGTKPHAGPPGVEVNSDGTDAVGVEAMQAPGLEPVSDADADAALKSALSAPEETSPTLPTVQALPAPSAPSPASGFPTAVFPSAPSVAPSLTPPAPSAPSPPPIPSPRRSAPARPTPPLQPIPRPTAAPAPAPAQVYAAEAPLSSGLDPKRIAEIQKHAKWAISALNYEDVATARKELRLALDKLGP